MYERLPLLENLMERLHRAMVAKPKAYLLITADVQEVSGDALVWGKPLQAQLERQLADRFEVVVLT